MTNFQSKTLGKDSRYSALVPWLIWGLGSFFYFYECLLQVSPSVMSAELMRDFSLTSQTLGVLSGIYFYSYAPMQMPGGLLIDYFGPTRLLTIATTVCALSTIAFGLTDNFIMACVARLMIGFGSSFAVVGSLKFAVNWFPATRFALLTGMMVTIGMLGAIGGEAPLALLIGACGWRKSMIIMGLIGLLLALMLLLFAKDSPNEIPDNQASVVEQKQESLLTSLKALIKNCQLWCVAIYGGLMYMSTPVFCGLWGVPFLMLKMNLPKTTAANYISLIFVGWAIASPLWGIYSNRIGLRKPPMYIASIGALISSLLFIYAPIDSIWLLEFLFLSFGIFSAGFLPAFSIAKELCSKRYIGTGLSFMNMINMVGVALLQPIVGYILDKMWHGQLINNIRVYPLSSYYIALSLLPLGIFCAFLILPQIKETYCQSVDS